MKKRNMKEIAKSLAIVIGVFLLPLSAQALDQIGNGGDVIVCNDGLELLDLYEARILRGYTLDLGDPALDYLDKIKLVLERINKFDSHKYTNYLGWLNAFMDEALFLDNAQLADVPDSQETVIPSGCHLEQIAIQRKPQLPGDKRYLINNDLWKTLDNNNKAALVLHEFLYRQATEPRDSNGIHYHPDSRKARFFNGFITSTLLPNIDRLGYAKMTVAALLTEEVRNETDNGTGVFYRMHAPSIEGYPSGKIKSGYLVNSATFYGHSFGFIGIGSGIDDLYIELYESGKLKYGKVNYVNTETGWFKCADGTDRFLGKVWVSFDENGLAICEDQKD